ncbi:MAG: chemotaxis response regulator protein-glutamate methylesterase [gamma proteobacterium symbiont of Taylorina sp.]|nr:chemotaxis response regulator protein-glutamate methylesterase [gamma proteobacterium symbiont of Taylorina sp.]
MIKVFIIDDAILVRSTIKSILSKSKTIQVIGEAENPVEAFEQFKKVGLPDVFILDIEMPKMDGLTFLKQIQEQKPIPTIICSAFVEAGSSKAIESLRLGACDIILKPNTGLLNSIDDISDEFIAKIKAAAQSKSFTHKKTCVKNDHQPLKKTHKIIAIGASTGGVQTLEKIFLELRPNHSPIVVVQHMPEGFTASFANSLNKHCKNSMIKEAKAGDILSHGQILIAPGDRHLEVIHEGLFIYKVVLKNFPKVSNHKPSVDVIFTSLAKQAKQNSIAFILTGMGKDGAQGIKKIKEAGGKTYGQDEKTSVVYGMPKVAFELGGVEKQIPLQDVANIINNVR